MMIIIVVLLGLAVVALCVWVAILHRRINDNTWNINKMYNRTALLGDRVRDTMDILAKTFSQAQDKMKTSSLQARKSEVDSVYDED